MWGLRLLVFLIVGAVVTSGVARADDQRAILPLTVNTQSKGDILTIVREDDVVVPVADLEKAGLHGFTGTRQTIDGSAWVSLRSLAPDLTYVFDESALTLAITANGKFFGAHTYDLGIQRPADLVYSTAAGAYLNYALSETDHSPSAFLESSITNGIARLYLSGYTNSDTGFARGEESLIWDDRQKLRTTTIGDATATGGDLGSSALLTGFDIRRNNGLDPYVVTYPTVGTTGVVSTPSTADIYVNGILVQRLNLPPGPYNLNNIPIPNGIANTRIVIRDAFGAETVVQRNLYQTSQLLAKGQTDYDYAVGFDRVSEGTTLDSEQAAAQIGRYSIGLTDAFTVGARFEHSTGLVSGGPVVDLRLPLGELHVAAAASSANGTYGTATSLGYNYSGRYFGFGIFQTALSENYARVDLPLATDRALVDLLATASVNASRKLSFSGNYERQNFRDTGVGSTTYVGATYTFDEHVNLNVNASRSFGASLLGRADSLYVTLTYTGNHGTSVAATYQNVAGAATPMVNLQHPLPNGNGVGYTATVTGGPVKSFFGDVIANVPFGQYTLYYGAATGSTLQADLTLAGSLVTLGHGVFFGRPIQDGFAIVDASGSDRLNIQQENQDVATAQGSAHIVLPNLVPNFANRISAQDPHAPINTNLDYNDFVVAPAVKSGVRVRFTVDTFRAFEGTLVIDNHGTPLIPAFGQLTVTAAGKTYRSDLGDKGEFYFENLPAGALDGVAEYREGQCALRVTVPDVKDITVDLGALTCTVP